MLEGKELEGKIGDKGSYSIDVDDKGNVKMAAAYADDISGVKIKSENSIETNVLDLLEQVALKNNAKWGVDAIKTVKTLLGIL